MYIEGPRQPGHSSCTHKIKYGHEITAQSAASVMANKKKETFEAYKCRHCDGWHIGHPRRNHGERTRQAV